MMEKQRSSKRKPNTVPCAETSSSSGCTQSVGFSPSPHRFFGRKGKHSGTLKVIHTLHVLADFFSVRQTERHLSEKISKNVRAYVLPASPVTSHNVHHIVHKFYANSVDSCYSWWMFQIKPKVLDLSPCSVASDISTNCSVPQFTKLENNISECQIRQVGKHC